MDLKKQKKSDLIKTVNKLLKEIDSLTNQLNEWSNYSKTKEYIIVDTNSNDSATVKHLKKQVKQVKDENKKLAYMRELSRLQSMLE